MPIKNSTLGVVTALGVLAGLGGYEAAQGRVPATLHRDTSIRPSYFQQCSVKNSYESGNGTRYTLDCACNDTWGMGCDGNRMEVQCTQHGNQVDCRRNNGMYSPVIGVKHINALLE